MAQKLDIWPQAERQVDGYRERRAVIEMPDGGRRTLWFRQPEEARFSWTDHSDPFAISLIFAAMQATAPMHVHGTVSPSLLRNLEEFQVVWQTWRPERHTVVSLHADCEREPAPAPDAVALSCFSGGVDGCFTAFRHARNHCGRQRKDLRAGLLVHGFDIPLTDKEGFARAAANAQEVLDSIDLPLMTVSTNIRELPLAWTDVYATSCAAVLSFFQPHFRYGLIGGNETYDYLQPIASNPLTDPMMSSDSFQIVHDGAGYSRVDKIDLVARWPEALRRLHVCWEGQLAHSNCGHCEKCIRTILGFRVNGHPLPPCFGRDVTDKDIATIPPLTGPWLTEYQAILDRALANGLGREAWVRALDAKLRRNHWHFFWPRLRHHVAMRTRVKRFFRVSLGKQSVAERH